MICSLRGIPLILQTTSNVPTLTVENYSKWYDTFIVHPDGSVTSGYDFYANQIDQFPGTWMGDHCFNPDFIQMLEDRELICVDDVSMDAIIGRWLTVFLEQEKFSSREDIARKQGATHADLRLGSNTSGYGHDPRN